MGFSKKCEHYSCKKVNGDIYTMCEQHYKAGERGTRRVKGD